MSYIDVEQQNNQVNQRKTCLQHISVPFIAQLVLLLCVVVACSICFGYNIKNLQTINNRIYDFKTCQLISSCIFSLSYQPINFGTSAAASDPELVSLINEIEHRKRVSIDFGEVQKNLDDMFKYGQIPTQTDEFTALAALETLTLQFTHQLGQQTSQQLDQSAAVQAGFECVSEQLIQLYFHNALMQDNVFPDWQRVQFQMYEGLIYDRLSYPDCIGFIPLTSTHNFNDAINNGPTLSAMPTLTFEYTESPLSQDTVIKALETLKGEVATVEKNIEKFWSKQKRDTIVISIFSLVSGILCACFALLSPFFYSGRLDVVSGSSMHRYRVLEGKLRLLGVYASSIVALKEDPHLYRLLDGTFLVKLIGFIRRARPFVPQTGFGDIESIVLSSTENGMYGGNFIGGNVVGGNAAGEIGVNDGMEDDQRAQELRTEVGLQVAYGTMMCLSSRGLVHFSEDDDELSSECVSLNGALSVIERIANGRHGAIHSVTHRFLYISWNVNSSCPDHELEALYTALEIHEALRELCVDLSISIATSLVVAGTVEESEQRAVMVCGPAMLCCEKLQALNRYHKTTIAMDKQVAGKVFSLNVPGADYCAVPISLYRVSPAKSQYDVAYGLFPSRLTEPLKAWATMLKDFPSQMEAKRIREMLMAVEEYKATFPSNAGGGGADAVSIEPTIRFWMMTLEALRYAEYQGK